MAEILHQLRLVVYPIIYRVSYIPGGARFQPSTVVNYLGRLTQVFFCDFFLWREQNECFFWPVGVYRVAVEQFKGGS